MIFGVATPALLVPVAAASPSPSMELPAGSLLQSGQTLVSTNGAFDLVMQADGNVVEYWLVDGGVRVVWNSGTNGNPGAYLDMQDDGNLVVYSVGGTSLWASDTAGNPGAILEIQNDANLVIYGSSGSALWSTQTGFAMPGPSLGPSLTAGQTIEPGQYLESPNGDYRLFMTPRGAPGLYQENGRGGLSWLMEGGSSLTSPANGPPFASCALCLGATSPGSFLTLQAEGNLVLYPPQGGPAEWSAGVADKGGTTLVLQDDGNLVLYGTPSSPSAPPAVVWQTGTELFRGTILGEGLSLGPGQFILSSDGMAQLVMQNDGNLVMYSNRTSQALWQSGTSGHPGASVTMQNDGNLVIYGPSDPAGQRADAIGADTAQTSVPLWQSFSSNAMVSGYLIPDYFDPSTVATSLQTPLDVLNNQVNVLLGQIDGNPTPNQGTIVQLQMAVQQFTNLLQLDSAITKNIEDAQKTIINNISS
jgi:hypothetical protein